jgi:O-methyltransferase involved in polyketide biosynthesis
MYLTERAIDDTFAMLRELLRPGSVVVFTYFTKARLQRTSLGSRLLSRHVASIGEPWRFGWEPASLPQWLETRGFQLLSDDESGLLARKWLPPHLARRVPADGRRIARVTPA